MSEPIPILVVEDDRNFLELIGRALEHGGFECLKARSGEEGLSLAQARAPRAAIVDGLLPGMRGDELVRRLRGLFDAQALPILFVSSFFRDLRSFRYLTGECGVSRVLHKPIAPEELLAALERTLAADGAEPPADETVTEVRVDFAAEIAELLPDYLQASRERVVAMRAALRQLGSVDEEAGRETLRGESHRLRGSGASFGLPEISRLAGGLETLTLEAGRPLAATDRARLSGLVAALAEKLACTAGERPIAIGADAPAALRLALVDGPTELAASCRLAAAAGAELAVFADAEAALEALVRPAEDGHPVQLVLVADDRPEFDAPGLCARLRAAGVGPIALLSDDGSLRARIGAVQAGAALFLPRPPDAASLLAIAGALAPCPAGLQALGIDEDSRFLAGLAPAFAGRQIALQPCLEPAEAFESLAQGESRLALIGPNLTRCGQLELVRALRADPRFSSLPLLVLTRAPEPGGRERQLEALEAGAELFVGEPFCAEELAARARALADRAAARHRAPLHDPLTGVWLRPWLEEACTRSLGLARRAGRILTLLVFDFDAEALARGQGRARCTPAALALVAQLRAAFRSTDLIARLGPGRFAVLLNDLTGEQARALLDVQLEAFAGRRFGAPDPEPVALRGALVSFPGTEGDGAAFVRAAEAALPG